MARKPPKLFLEHLYKTGILTKDTLQKVVEYHKKEPTLLISEILRNLKVISEKEFWRMLCEEFGSTYMDPALILQFPIEESALAKISSQDAESWEIVPLHYDPHKDRLLVVSAYPFNPHILPDLPRLISVKDVEVTFVPPEFLSRLWRKAYLGEEDFTPKKSSEWIGPLTDEEAFPGIYGHSVAEYLEREFAREEQTTSSQREGIHGFLEDLGIVDMLQALGQSRKTCSIYLRSGDFSAQIHLHDGFVVHAENSKGEKGPRVVYNLMKLQKGEFTIITQQYKGPQTMMESVEGLLLEGARLLDEESRK